MEMTCRLCSGLPLHFSRKVLSKSVNCRHLYNVYGSLQHCTLTTATQCTCLPGRLSSLLTYNAIHAWSRRSSTTSKHYGRKTISPTNVLCRTFFGFQVGAKPFSSRTYHMATIWHFKRNPSNFKERGLLGSWIHRISLTGIVQCSSCTHNKSHRVHEEKKNECGQHQETQKEDSMNPVAVSKYKESRENVLTVPNFLCLLRIALSPIIGYCAIIEMYSVGFGLLCFAGATDLLDGYIARHFKSQQSVFGSILDPAADKILMTVTIVSLSVANLIPVPLCFLVVGRDVALVAVVSYLRFKTLPPPKTVTRYFDVNHPTVQLHPTQISKVNTLLQLGLIGMALLAGIFQFTDSPWYHAYWYLVGTTTCVSGFSYVFSKDTFKILKRIQK